MMDDHEPTVLDYVKAKLMPWRGPAPVIPTPDQKVTAPVEHPILQVEPTPVAQPRPAVRRTPIHWPWRVMGAMLVVFVAQLVMDNPTPNITLALILYLQAGILLVWALILKEWKVSPLVDPANQPMPLTIRRNPLLAGIPIMVLAFLTLGGNLFTPLNVTLWIAAIALFTWAMWLSDPMASLRRKRFIEAVRQLRWPVIFTPWTIAVVLGAVLVFFFRFYHLSGVPGEMFSDHAEKLLDVTDVLAGQTHIFFTRNTGREFIQFYLTAAIIKIFGTGISFISLKIGTALAGLLTLPFIYLLGKEIANRWTGFLAFLLAGIAYWPNVISRVGLRFPLYPLFVAPTLYFLVRGLRHRNRNDFILSGLFLGLGLHGYSPIRFLPFVVVAAVLIYVLHRQSVNNRMPAVWALAALALISLIVFLPLLRFILEDQSGMFSYRALTRLATTERGYPAPVWLIFLGNLWSSLVMFFYKDGNIWVHSIPGRPAVDVITGGLYFLGSLILIYRYIRQRHWLDLFLLVSIPLLMMPSILSLAFPEENPSLNRSGGAIIPVFIIAAIALESGLSSIREKLGPNLGRAAVGILAAGMILISSVQNYNLVFKQYSEQFLANAWNYSEIGHVIRAFAESEGNPNTAYVVPYPYWVDTRLVGIEAGYGVKDYALWPEQFPSTLQEKRAKLFILYPDDSDSVRTLLTLYPNAALYRYDAKRDGKDFMLLFVPPAQDSVLIQNK